jgi:uncharacterized Rmd1/YagE family protein
MLSALNSKLRRRNSSGAPLQLPAAPGVKIGPQRTSVRTQKLKLLPNPELGDDGPDEESGKDVYSQFTRIKDPTARRDAARLGKDDRDKLPRVTAYCTASSYRLDELMRFLKGRSKTKSAHPKLFDECIYTPYQYRKDGEGINRRRGSATEQAEVLSQPQRRFSDSAIEVSENAERRREDLIDLQGDAEAGKFAQASTAEDTTVDETTTTNEALADRTMTPDFDTSVHIPEVFLFEYGVVVIWGMTVKEEQRFLKEISKFEQEKLGKDDVQTEEFNFYYTREYQARIYNDFISLREKRNYMTKLAISHALAQSTKVSLTIKMPGSKTQLTNSPAHRHPSTKTSSTQQSQRPPPSPPPSPAPAASTSPVAKSTCKSASSSSSASTSTCRAPCSTLPNSCGPNPNSNPSTKPSEAIWKWTRESAC